MSGLNGYLSRVKRLEDDYGSGVGCDRCRDWPGLFVQIGGDTALKAGYPPDGYCPMCGRQATHVVNIGFDERGPA